MEQMTDYGGGIWCKEYLLELKQRKNINLVILFKPRRL